MVSKNNNNNSSNSLVFGQWPLTKIRSTRYILNYANCKFFDVLRYLLVHYRLFTTRNLDILDH